MLARAFAGVIQANNAAFCANGGETEAVNSDPQYVDKVAAEIAKCTSRMMIEDAVCVLERALTKCAPPERPPEPPAPLKLVAIGTTGNFVVYVGLSRDEAVARFNREYPGDDAADYHIQELTVTDGRFWAYEINTTG
jgi:hypothetical protein